MTHEEKPQVITDESEPDTVRTDVDASDDGDSETPSNAETEHESTATDAVSGGLVSGGIVGDGFVDGEICEGSVLRGVVVGVAESSEDWGQSEFVLCQFPSAGAEFPVRVSASTFRDVKKWVGAPESNHVMRPDVGPDGLQSMPCSYEVRDTDVVTGRRRDPVVYLPVFSVDTAEGIVHVVDDVCATYDKAHDALESVSGCGVRLSVHEETCTVSTSFVRDVENKLDMGDGQQVQTGDELQHYMSGSMIGSGSVLGKRSERVIEWLQASEKRTVAVAVGAVTMLAFGLIWFITVGSMNVWAWGVAVVTLLVAGASSVEESLGGSGLLPESVVSEAAVEQYDASVVVGGESESSSDSVVDVAQGAVDEFTSASKAGERRVESVTVTVTRGDGWVEFCGDVDGELVTWRFESVNADVLPGVVRDVLASVPVVDGEAVVTVTEANGEGGVVGDDSTGVVSDDGEWVLQY